MIKIRCISHAPALLLLDLEGFQGQERRCWFYLEMAVLSDVLRIAWQRRQGCAAGEPGRKPWKGLVCGGLSATLIGAACSG